MEDNKKFTVVDGQSQRHIEFDRNIVKNKQSNDGLWDAEGILKRVFDTTYPMIAYMDVDFNFIRVNKQYAGMVGREPEFFIGKNHFDLYPNQENEMIFRNVVKTGEPISYNAKPFKFKGRPELGTTYWDWDLIPVKDQDNTVSSLILCLVNVTEKKRAEEALREANRTLEKRVRERTYELQSEIAERKRIEKDLRIAKEEAERASIIKSEFIANMSHELRTPLNVLFSAIQLFDLYLNNHPPSNIDKLNKHLMAMRQNCLRLLRLVNNLIDTTKIDANFLGLNMSNYNIVNIVEGITLSVKEYIKHNNIELNFYSDLDEIIIACDVDMIERIMFNLLSNAIKFTKPGGKIQVSILYGTERVIISVKDNGIGIPKEKQKIIFERYKQAHKLLTREYEGSGIGLSLTKSLVEMHGGRITVKSKCGKGSEFLVEFPVKVLAQNSIQPANTDYTQNNQRLIERMQVEFSDIYK